MDNYFKLFACCIPVKGAKRATICDLQRNTFLFISLEMFELFDNKDKFSVKEYNEDTNAIFSYLAEEDFGYFTNEPDKFPHINYTNKSEIPITPNTIIIDISANSYYNLTKLAVEIKNLRIYAIEIRLYESSRLSYIRDIIDEILNENIRTLHLTLKYNDDFNEKNLKNLIKNYRCITQIIIFSAQNNFITSELFKTSIIRTKEEIDDETHCGNISPFYFESNVLFYKNKTTNTCLSDKIGIDKNGFIRNCPSMPFNYGHINTTSLHEVINLKQFNKISKISKDEIEVCKDCEFRYICLDCRAYTSDDDLYSKPAKCKYNPYTNEWEN